MAAALALAVASADAQAPPPHEALASILQLPVSPGAVAADQQVAPVRLGGVLKAPMKTRNVAPELPAGGPRQEAARRRPHRSGGAAKPAALPTPTSLDVSTRRSTWQRSSQSANGATHRRYWTASRCR